MLITRRNNASWEGDGNEQLFKELKIGWLEKKLMASRTAAGAGGHLRRRGRRCTGVLSGPTCGVRAVGIGNGRKISASIHALVGGTSTKVVSYFLLGHILYGV